MSGDTPESAAMWAATLAARQVLAQAKNPRTTLGRMDATGVAYHAASAAITAYKESLAAPVLRDAQGEGQ